MTMQHQIHPEDERLAALAGGDPDVVADAGLRAHLIDCASCREVIDELATLRAALAELPDLVPSRRLQLIPPVAEPRAAAAGGWLRRLASPVMAAGFGLVLVGAVGTSGILNGFASGAAASAAPGANMEAASERQDAGTPLSADQQSERSLASGMDSQATGGSSDEEPAPGGVSRGETPASDDVAEVDKGAPAAASPNLFSTGDQRLPWLIVLGLGVGLLIAGLYLRFTVQPRSG